ncbi:DUF7508 domain-containing protein [Halostella salina]|uniref:DUF7508 domain-containing protein n=1 Tax=Halostella salina TaxID=1547897 RepID=UPI000EF80C53|nr:hypothetical protein [Halostella salina]
MPLGKQWRPLSRETVGRAPERYGMYELGEDGDVVEVGHGVLRDELKTALTYGDGSQVRWEETNTAERAAELAEQHRDRR